MMLAILRTNRCLGRADDAQQHVERGARCHVRTLYDMTMQGMAWQGTAGDGTIWR